MQHCIHHRRSLGGIDFYDNIFIVTGSQVGFSDGRPDGSVHLAVDHHPAWPLAESIRDDNGCPVSFLVIDRNRRIPPGDRYVGGRLSLRIPQASGSQ